MNKNIHQLKELVCQIETSGDFGKLNLPEKTPEGTLGFPYWEESEPVRLFRKLACDIPLLIEYDWASWQDGRQILQNHPEIPENMGIIPLCKLITMIIRADRFNEGFMIQQFENGNILRVLRALVDEAEKYEN
ncbi:MAG: hypothetical protein IPM26_17025 [Saprospiraceae bacterium]|nr:hypothetical protein [Saprospiraceae bacterium]